jgi:nitrous oxide reductase accessory protein NosL
MRFRLLLAVAATLTLAACSESPTSPRPLQPTKPSADEITCRTGYQIATRADGSQYCAP